MEAWLKRGLRESTEASATRVSHIQPRCRKPKKGVVEPSQWGSESSSLVRNCRSLSDGGGMIRPTVRATVGYDREERKRRRERRRSSSGRRQRERRKRREGLGVRLAAEAADAVLQEGGARDDERDKRRE